MIKNFFNIVINYHFYTPIVVIYEIFFLIRGFKGNKVKTLNHKNMTDCIPAPYYFLTKIANELKKLKIKSFIDFGCGSGRIIFFLNNYLKIKKIIGIEYDKELYFYCKKIFLKNQNIKILKKDFTKINFNFRNINCFIFNDPLSKKSFFLRYFNNNYTIFKNKYLILINFDLEVLEAIKFKSIIKKFYISKRRGFIIIKI